MLHAKVRQARLSRCPRETCGRRVPQPLVCHHSTAFCRDLRNKKPQSGLLFNALFNLDKFLKFENRDPFAMRAEAGEFAGLTEWDKFAKIEYYR